MPWSKGCSVGGCKNSGSSRPSGTSMHRFPRNEALREAWTTFVNLSRSKSNWKPTKCKYICSEHFSQDCFDSKHRFFVTLGLPSQKKNLLAGAIPSILPEKVTSYAEEPIKKNVDSRVETFHQCVVCDQMFQNASVLEIHRTQHKEKSNNNENVDLIPESKICDEEIKLGYMETDLDEYNEPPIVHFKKEKLIKNISHHCIHCKKGFWHYTKLEEHTCSGGQAPAQEKKSKTSVSLQRNVFTESAAPCTKLEDHVQVIDMSYEPHSDIGENQKDEESQIYDQCGDVKNENLVTEDVKTEKLVSEDGCTNESSASSSFPFGVSNDPFGFQHHSDTDSNISNHTQESKQGPSREWENNVCDKCFQQYSDLGQHICIQDHFMGTFNFNNRNDTDNILESMPTLSMQSTGAADDSETTMESEDTMSHGCLHSAATQATESQAGADDSETATWSDDTLSHGCLYSAATQATQSQAGTNESETATWSDDTLSYKCLHCGESFHYFQDLCQHTCTEEKAKKNSDEGKISGKNYVVFSGLNNQTKSHGQFFKCDVCERTFKDQNTLVKHMKVHACNDTKKNLFQGENVFSRKYSATGKQTKTDPGEKMSKCEICSKAFVNDICVTMAKCRTIHGVEHYKCSVCHKSFLHKFNAKKHINEVHSGNEKSSKCKICECMDATTRNRRRRIKRETFLKCGVCNETFTEYREYVIHIRIHKSKRHFCSVCCKSFASKNSLRQHKLVHSVSECYECIFCGTSFSELEKLQMHIHSEH